MATGENKITINFVPKGDTKLINAFRGLAEAQKKFNNSSNGVTNSSKKVNKSLVDMTIQVKKTGKSWKQLGIDSKTLKKAFNGSRVALDKMKTAMGKTRKNARLLDNTFATLRSKMLLFQFAMALGVRQLIDFAQQAAKVDDMSRAFTNLSGGTENASIAVDKLKQATNETMSEFDLFQQANNAMVLGVSKNSDEMAHMFDVAQRLGAALGKDTKHSVESLITGIGRQSRLMLDNIGIIVRSDEAYQDYADRIGVTKDQLTDTQKKQAFLNATMEAAEKKLESVGEEVISYNAKIQIASARMADMRVEIGNKLLPLFSTLAHHFTDTATIKGYASAITVVTLGYGAYHKAAILATIATKGFKLALQRLMAATGIGIAVALLGELAANFLFAKNAVDDTAEATDKYNVILRDATPILTGFSDQQQRQIALAKDQIRAFSMLLDPFESLRNMYSQTEEGQLEQLNTQIALIESLGGFTEKNKDLSAVYSRLLEQRDKLLKQDKDTKDSFEEISFGAKIANKSIGMVTSEMARLVIEGKSLSKLKLGDVLGQMALSMAFTGILGGGVGALFGGGFKKGALGALGIAHTGGHIKEDGSVQKFATGGVVQGQDNVPILAQAGEFVMQRSAVESVGLEAMNRINAGGGAGSVVVNVSGNVMSQDYVEGELANQLKEAIRRGADIGVS